MARTERQELYCTGDLVMDSELRGVAGGTFAGGVVTPGTGVTLTADKTRAVRHATLTLSGFVISVAAADDYGGTKLCDLPDTNIMLLAVEANLELVKGEVTGGIVDTTDVTVAVGTAIASNAVLSGAMVDVLTGIALTATDASPAYQIHSSADGSLSYPILLADAATLALYLNAACAITADDTITASGTVDLYWVDIGNVTS